MHRFIRTLRPRRSCVCSRLCPPGTLPNNLLDPHRAGDPEDVSERHEIGVGQLGVGVSEVGAHQFRDESGGVRVVGIFDLPVEHRPQDLAQHVGGASPVIADHRIGWRLATAEQARDPTKEHDDPHRKAHDVPEGNVVFDPDEEE